SARDGGKSPEGFVYDVNAGRLPVFWKDLIRNEAFQAYMKERYAQLRQTVWTEERLLKSIDALEKKIGSEAIHRNFLRFPVWGAKNLETYSQLPASYDQEMEGMKQWLQNRLRWMDSQLK